MTLSTYYWDIFACYILSRKVDKMARCLNFELYESHLPHFHGSVAFISIYSHVIF